MRQTVILGFVAAAHSSVEQRKFRHPAGCICMTSAAIIPPRDRPAIANGPGGMQSSTQRAVVSQESKIERGALRQSGTAMSDKAAH